LSDPAKICLSTVTYDLDDDDITAPASNVSRQVAYHTREDASTTDVAGGVVELSPGMSITDSGATQIFVMDGTPVVNRRPTTRPLRVALADGRIVTSTHMCDITIEGLPTTLTGHIVPNLSVASLFGICVLTSTGCKVTFTNNECIVRYKKRIILRGAKDPAMDLWTLPLGPLSMTSKNSSRRSPLVALSITDTHAHRPLLIAFFAHTMRTKANSIRFAHQSLCSPTIPTLLKAIKRGYIKGCPNLTARGVKKYLNPSPATTKGHMKRPRQGIRSTRRDTTADPSKPPLPTLPARTINASDASTESGTSGDSDSDSDSVHPTLPSANMIEDDDDSDANVFIFAAFADKNTGTLYSDLTGSFPFMSLEGDVCFLVVYHYESILAVPLPNFTDVAILTAYKSLELLEAKGHTIRLNVIDNQANAVIKRYLTLKECENMLVEPHNHRVNAAERAIQTFKAHFISALATTDSAFQLQLWDRLTPQVVSTLNMLRPSRIDPTMSAYEAVHGPYDWNRFPLAPSGCKAVIYEAPEVRGFWGSHGTNAWCVGPSLDHYQCNHYFVPDTRACRMSGSAELFPQHCQVPFLLWNENFQEVIDELASTLNKLAPDHRVKFLRKVYKRLEAPPPKDVRTLTAPSQEWMLPRTGDIQLDPYVPPPQQRVELPIPNHPCQTKGDTGHSKGARRKEFSTNYNCTPNNDGPQPYGKANFKNNKANSLPSKADQCPGQRPKHHPSATETIYPGRQTDSSPDSYRRSQKILAVTSH
jgi:hypothetical protein